MSAQDNLSSQQWHQPELSLTVYRGLTQTPNKGKKAGMHWSLSKRVADTISRQTIPSWKADFYGSEGHPTVLKGEVPMSSVETDKEELGWRGVYTDPKDFNFEQEVPVKHNAPIYVTERTQHKMFRSRTRRYNPPREMLG